MTYISRFDFDNEEIYRSARVQGHFALYVHGKMIWNDGQKAALVGDILPVQFMKPPAGAGPYSATVTIPAPSFTIDVSRSNRYQSVHDCKCLECEDCQATFHELANKPIN